MQVSQPRPINWYYYPSIRLVTQPKLKTQSNSWVLYQIEKYTNGLIVQWNRMIEDLFVQQQVMKTDLSNDVQAQGALYQIASRLGLDIHFYLVCLDKINKYLGRFARNMSEFSCVQSVWKNLGPLTEKASRARDFFEHLDKNISDSNIGERGYSFVNFEQFNFHYDEVSKKGTKFEREVVLGRAEVEKVMKAYEEILSCLGADISLGYKTG